MWPMIGGAISALGSIFGASQQSDAARETAQMNIANQREFAQRGIQWRVADAEQAGIHPLYALGANTTSYSNVAGDPGIGAGVAQAGQDIGRAVTALGNQEQRELAVAGAKLDLETKGLQNDVLRAELASRIAKATQPGTPPAFPTIVAGGGNAGSGSSVTPDVKRTGTNWFGGNAQVANLPDAQTIQNRYGEPAEWLYFPVVAGADATVNAWPYISRFFDATGLGKQLSADEWAALQLKFGRYMKGAKDYLNPGNYQPGYDPFWSRHRWR